MKSIQGTTFFASSPVKDMVIKSILYIGCGTFLLTGSQVVNRFIGGNVSANSGREQLMSMMGFGQAVKTTALASGVGALGMGKVSAGAISSVAGKLGGNKLIGGIGNSISQSVSLMNYNGNKSTSLMARDLLTPDEVKNLHYKAIIFPNFGYPIFRDTVGYPKLSCYSSGELKRTINPLENLNHTYFTVEMIKLEEEPSIHNIRARKNNINNISPSPTFKEVERVLEVILKDVVYEVLYKQNSNE